MYLRYIQRAVFSLNPPLAVLGRSARSCMQPFAVQLEKPRATQIVRSFPECPDYRISCPQFFFLSYSPLVYVSYQQTLTLRSWCYLLKKASHHHHQTLIYLFSNDISIDLLIRTFFFNLIFGKYWNT